MNSDMAYKLLVDRRRECRECRGLGLTNPASDEDCRWFDEELGHIGPWTAWQGSLRADLMVVGQDWGRVQEFRDQGGLDCGGNPTNVWLRRLLDSIGIKANPPGWKENSRLYFTNAVLCLKPDGWRTNPRCFSNCTAKFMSAQIDLVAPKVVVTLGYQGYLAVMSFYGREPERSMSAAVGNKDVTTFERIGGGKSILVPVFHPGVRGRLTRSEQEQIEDWKRVRLALES